MTRTKWYVVSFVLSITSTVYKVFGGVDTPIEYVMANLLWLMGGTILAVYLIGDLRTARKNRDL